MQKAILRSDTGDFPFIGRKTTLGRSSDNAVSFAGDSNVSRYHAEIEKRGDEYTLIDLGSSNGTSVNGKRVSGESLLSSGDTILLGGSARIAFELVEEPEQERSENEAFGEAELARVDLPRISEITPPIPETVANSHTTLLFVCAGAGLVLVVIIAATAVYMFSGSACTAKAKVNKPESGDTIITPTDIDVDVDGAACVSRAVFSIDGIEFAEAEEAPYSANIDPKEFPELADGNEHTLIVALQDATGNETSAASPVRLAFESREVAKPVGGRRGDSPQAAVVKTPDTGRASLVEINDMAKRLIKLFPASAGYNISNKQFLQEVQQRTAEYAVAGYTERASKYRDKINVAFVREQNLDAPLGFLLAMSRSKFMPEKQASDEGIWKMNASFAAASGYTGLCGAETLSDPEQNCAAKAAALYMKALVLGVFDGDPIYSVAAFGKSPQDAGAWKATLPPNRSDVWNAIKGPAEREQLVRFFAAGIVAENPQKFGLQKDRPLSELYRLAM